MTRPSAAQMREALGLPHNATLADVSAIARRAGAEGEIRGTAEDDRNAAHAIMRECADYLLRNRTGGGPKFSHMTVVAERLRAGVPNG